MTLGIFGSGALGREVYEIVKAIENGEKKWEKIFFIEDSPEEKIKWGVDNITLDEFCDFPEDKEIVIAVGEPFAREKLRERLREKDIDLSRPIIHPTCKIACDTMIGRGTVICYGCHVSFESVIGENVYIQPGCGIGHNDVIGNNTIISGGSRIAGYVNIGKNTYLGMLVPVRDRTNIGSGTIVSLGSVVQKDIPDNVIAMGNPARPIKTNADRKIYLDK